MDKLHTFILMMFCLVMLAGWYIGIKSTSNGWYYFGWVMFLSGAGSAIWWTIFGPIAKKRK